MSVGIIIGRKAATCDLRAWSEQNLSKENLLNKKREELWANERDIKAFEKKANFILAEAREIKRMAGIQISNSKQRVATLEAELAAARARAYRKNKKLKRYEN